MKDFARNFCLRGLMYAWGGPVIMAIVWMCLAANGTISELTVREVTLGIMSTTVMAFVAAGISVVYQMENLPRPFAALIQASVLYIDYLGIYLLNGWVPVSQIGMFSLIFVAIFGLIWACIYIPIRRKVKRMNRMMADQAE
ncbi:MAG: DUF3021 domain-containing protein [Clostridia bacterium]|nr:DUF3021 domain-containing protein [Clostridia bacterium]